MVVGFRRIELAIRTVRLGAFSLAMLPPLFTESVEAVFGRPVGSSGGAEAEVLPALLSGMAGM